MHSDNTLHMDYKGNYFLINLKKGIKMKDCTPNFDRALHLAKEKNGKADVLFNVENLSILSKSGLEVLISTYAKIVDSGMNCSIVNIKYPRLRQQIEEVNKKIIQHKKKHHPPMGVYNTLDECLQAKGYEPKPETKMPQEHFDEEIEQMMKKYNI